MRIVLSFAQAAQLLEFAHQIDVKHSDAFRARLKHLQRLGFPSGINTGKGKAAQYGWRELFLQFVALELIELGLTPERARIICSVNEGAIMRAFSETIYPKILDRDARFLVIHSASLDHLRSDERDESNAISILPLKKIKGMFGNDSIFSRIAIVNLTSIYGHILAAPHIIGFDYSEGELADSILKWAQDYNDQHPQT